MLRLHPQTALQARTSSAKDFAFPQRLGWANSNSKLGLLSRGSLKLQRLDAVANAVPSLESVQRLSAGSNLGKNYEELMAKPNKGRRAGIILHPTSLPGPYGIGVLGKECLQFIDWLEASGMQIWQVLPLVPPDPEYFSPYSGLDANGGNPLLLSLESLVEDGILTAADLPPTVPPGDVDFIAVTESKTPVLKKAAANVLSDPNLKQFRDGLAAFRKKNSWVEDSALFDVIRRQPENVGLYWWHWEEPLRFRKSRALDEAKKKFAGEIDEFIVIQYLFDRQWKAVKEYANSKGVLVVGDMPIYVGGHSADVWANQGLFELSDTGAPGRVSGVPPDAFSDDGQLWGSPLYKWDAHRSERYKWWTARLARALELYDETRIDHFRAFAGYWAVDATAKTAVDGAWLKGPGKELFDAVEKGLGRLPLLAEDLGVITDDVTALRLAIGAPGMVVLQFAWGGGPGNVHLPHMHTESSFVYTGTHDNETTVGWYLGSANDTDKSYIKEYLGSDGSDIAWDFIKEAFKSVAKTAVMPLQDVLRLDNSARMNVPGRASGNWAWRLTGDVAATLAPHTEPLRQIAYSTLRLADGKELREGSAAAAGELP